MISWKKTETLAVSRLRWLLELWMSSDTLLSRSCMGNSQSGKDHGPSSDLLAFGRETRHSSAVKQES